MASCGRILVMDDDANLRKTLADILWAKGYEVAVAGTGADAIAEAARDFVNVALIDLKLPDISGIEVMGRIKLASPLTEAIILTGHAALETAIEATNKGAFSYLLKPYQIDELLQQIRHAIERQQGQQEILRLASFPKMDPAPIIELDASWRVTYLNPAAERLFPEIRSQGMAHPLLEGLQDLFTAFYKGEQQEAVREVEVGNAIYERRIYFVPESNFIRVTALDITWRKKSEEALRGSETRYRRLFESTKDGILLLDAATAEIFDVNPFMVELLGYAHSEYIGKKFWEIGLFKDVAASKALFDELCSQEFIHYEDLALETKAGVKIDVEFISSIYPVNGDSVIQCNLRDITVHKMREDKITKLNVLLVILRDINEKLLTVDSEQSLFQFVCESLRRLEDIVIAWVVCKKPQPKIAPLACSGVDEAELSDLQLRWDDIEQGVGFIGGAAQQLKPVVINEVESDPRLAGWQTLLQKWDVKSAISIPIHEGGDVIAILSLFSRRLGAFDDEIVDFLREVSGDVAVGLRTLRLDNNLHSTLDHLRESMDSTVEAIARMVELRDPYTAGHERRVAQLARAIGKTMGLPERQVEGIRVIGYLHDIGKIAVPAEILSKPSALSDIEMAMIRVHPNSGYEILKSLDFPWPVAQAVLQHHERLDGSGYPQGLKGEDIILEARIIMVADVVEAMVSHRPYRAGKGLDVALEEINKNKGTLYDPKVVVACVSLFAEHEFMFDGSF